VVHRTSIFRALLLIVASLDLVRDVQIFPPLDDAPNRMVDTKTLGYSISWRPPLTPNGLIYFYTVLIEQYDHNGPKNERCLGHDTHVVNVSLLPTTSYRLRIFTYTLTRFNQEYDDAGFLHDETSLINATNMYYQLFFTTIDSPSRRDRCLRPVQNCFLFAGVEITRQNRLAMLLIITGAVTITLTLMLGALAYYYRYGRPDVKASISKNPNYGQCACIQFLHRCRSLV
jgi:hypothetical protein